MLRDSISKLDKYAEVVNSKKRQRTSSPSDKGGGVALTKMGSQIHRSPNDAVIQRSEGKPTSAMMNKRIRTLGTDVRVCISILLLILRCNLSPIFLRLTFYLHFARYILSQISD